MNRFLEQLASFQWQKIILGSIVIGGLYYAMLYDPGTSLDIKVQAARKQLNDIKEKLERTKAAEKNFKVFVEKIEAAQQQFQQVIAYMPPDMNLGNFMQKVKDQASAAGASVQAFSPSSDVEKHDFYEVRKFDLQLSGNFSQIVTFFSNLTKMPLLITFNKISLKSLSGDFDNPRLNFKGTLLGYRYMKEAASAKAGDKPGDKPVDASGGK